MSPEFATHALSRLSTATPKAWDKPPPENGEPGAGDPSGRSSATLSLATPATKMLPRFLVRRGRRTASRRRGR